MGPKVAAAVEFVETTGGKADIGALKDAEAEFRSNGDATAAITNSAKETDWQ